MCLLTSSLLVILLAATAAQAQQEDARKGHLKEFGQQGDIANITEYDGYVDPPYFFKHFIFNIRPVIMRGAAKNWPAYSKWTDEYLGEKLMTQGPAGDVLAHKIEKFTLPKTQRYMSIRQFKTTFRNDDETYLNDTVPEVLKPDIIVPYSLQCDRYWKERMNRTGVMYIPGRLYAPIRQQLADRIACLVRGSVKYTLVDYYVYSDLGPAIVPTSETGDDMDRVSIQDPDVIDLDKNFHFIGVNSFYGEVNAGDCIHIPADWLYRAKAEPDTLEVWFEFHDRWRVPVTEKDCNKEEKLDWTLDKMFVLRDVAIEEADAKRIIETFIKLGATKPDSLRELLIPKEMVKSAEEQLKPGLEELVPKIFQHADMNKDGVISEKDLKTRKANRLKRLFKTKARQDLLKTVDAFNRLIRGVHELSHSFTAAKCIYRTRGANFIPESAHGFPEELLKEEKKPEKTEL